MSYLPASIGRLHRDHIDFVKLLEVLQHQQRLLAAHIHVNWDIERGIVSFYKNYLEQCHHRVEGIIYEKLKEHDASLATRIGDIQREHRDCAELLGVFEGAVSLMAASKPTVRQRGGQQSEVHDKQLYDYYCSQLDAFVQRERQHMTDEELILQFAVRHLSEGEWHAIDKQLSAAIDETSLARFDRLRDAVFSADKPSDGKDPSG